MDFSVLISSFAKDKPEELQIALQSIWDDQTVKPTEIVIVKDGPLTAELDAVISDFATRAPVKIVPLPENVGLGKALAVGVENCSCEYIARMDSDDISVPDRFKKQCDFIQNNPATDFLGSAINEFVDDPAKPYSSKYVPAANEDIRRYARSRSPFNHMTVMYRRSFVLRVGNYQPFDKYEDYWLWIRAIHAGAVCANIPEPLVMARAGENMINRRRGYKLFLREINLIKKMRQIGFIPRIMVPYLFVCRALPRILPLFVLKRIYKILHK